MKRLLFILFILSTSSVFAQTRFVRSEDSKHKVVSISDIHFTFDGRNYYIDVEGVRVGYYRHKMDSITWVYGHSSNNWRDMVKVGFYNDRRNYVVSIKSEKLDCKCKCESK